jgi:hypothetical protein
MVLGGAGHKRRAGHYGHLGIGLTTGRENDNGVLEHLGHATCWATETVEMPFHVTRCVSSPTCVHDRLRDHLLVKIRLFKRAGEIGFAPAALVTGGD